MRIVQVVSALAAVLAVATYAGCDSESEEPRVCTTAATFESLRTAYFAESCAFSVCHSTDQREGNLDLSLDNANLYDDLVGTLANDDNAAGRGKMRIVAGDPDNSFLLQKVEGSMAPDEGALMPQGALEVDLEDCRPGVLRDWIAAGAPR